MKGNTLRKKFEGAMLGCALGDAIGELAFKYRHRKTLENKIDALDLLVFTDDTAMAIALAESLIKMKAIDQEDIGNTFAKHYLKEPWRGYAAGPPTIFAMVADSKISYVDAAKRLYGGEGSFGNGAAMRIVPVGLRFYDLEDLYNKAAATAEVTHAHPVGKDGAAIQALAIAQAVKAEPHENLDQEAFLDMLISSARTREIRKKLTLVDKLIRDNAPPQKAARELGKSVAVHESMPFSLYSFLKNHQSFEECLFCAVLHGGDRDTLGAMACSISGAYLGVNKIPEKWLTKLERREYIMDLGKKLFLSKISTQDPKK